MGTLLSCTTITSGKKLSDEPVFGSYDDDVDHGGWKKLK